MAIFKQKKRLSENKHQVCNPTRQDDFNSVACWHYDRYESQLVQANRWLLAFWLQTGFSILLMISFCLLLPLKTLVPLIIRQNMQTHEVFVDKVDKSFIPDQSQIESDLVRYIALRETYSLIDFPIRYQQVMFQSGKTCADEYRTFQANANPESPINLYGREGIRTVHVEAVVFLSNKKNKNNSRNQEPVSNLAKIDFVTTETINHQSIDKYWVATVSWEYKGTPSNKEEAWQNWNGFTVTYYRVDQRSVQDGRAR